MGRKGKRRTLAPNIYEDGSGFAVIVSVGGKLTEKRFPRGTPLEELEDERNILRGHQSAAKPARPGTLRSDVLSYLRTVEGKRKLKDQTMLCAHWVALYGDVNRHLLTPLVIRQQLTAWRQGGAAASTCNHRLSALRAVWRAVADPDEPNYPAQVKKLQEPHPEPRALDYATITAILDAMPRRSLSKLRLTLMAYSGLPPSQIMRIHPGDIDWATPALRARPRRKGKGTRESWLPLLPPAVDALRGLLEKGVLPGTFSTHSLHAVFRRACKAAKAPEGLRPYDLRHSFGTLVLAQSGDLAAVQHLLQHTSPVQTVRYTLAAIPAGAARAAALVSETLSAKPDERKPMAPAVVESENGEKQAEK